MLEGELIKRQVLENQEKERQKEMERKIKNHQAREEFKRNNEELQFYN